MSTLSHKKNTPYYFWYEVFFPLSNLNDIALGGRMQIAWFGGSVFPGCLSVAVDAAVDALLPVGKAEFLREIVFLGRDAPGILALADPNEPLGQCEAAALGEFPVADHVHGDPRIQIAEHIQVQIQNLSDLDDVLPAQLLAFCVLDHGHGAV